MATSRTKASEVALVWPQIQISHGSCRGQTSVLLTLSPRPQPAPIRFRLLTGHRFFASSPTSRHSAWRILVAPSVLVLSQLITYLASLRVPRRASSIARLAVEYLVGISFVERKWSNEVRKQRKGEIDVDDSWHYSVVCTWGSEAWLCSEISSSDCRWRPTVDGLTSLWQFSRGLCSRSLRKLKRLGRNGGSRAECSTERLSSSHFEVELIKI